MSSINYQKSNTLRKKSYALKKQKKLMQIRILLILFLVFIIFSFHSLRKTYISHKCRNITYAVDYYFTKYKNDNLRLLGVESINYLEKDEDSAKVEVVGLSYTSPRYKETLIGNFKKNKDGSWEMNKVSKVN